MPTVTAYSRLRRPRPQNPIWMPRLPPPLSPSLLVHAHVRTYAIATLITGILLVIIGLLNIRIKIPYNEQFLRPHDVVCSYIPSHDEIQASTSSIGRVTVRDDGTVLYDDSDIRKMKKKEMMTSVCAFGLMVSAIALGLFLVVYSSVILGCL